MTEIGMLNFIADSNLIEGIQRPPTGPEIGEHERFLALDEITVAELERFVSIVAPDAVLRRELGWNVRVGGHYPPPGGPPIERRLVRILSDDAGPYETHVAYEKLHPFTDGNGRSGRALWAWQMRRAGMNAWYRPFLLQWYYQSLDASRDASVG